MASLIVRKVDIEVVKELKARAASNGRSAEAEHRAILDAALRSPADGAELWRRMRRYAGAELPSPQWDDTVEPATFS